MEMSWNDAAEVLFIAMPFCDEYMPCLTLALFKPVLERAGIKSRVQHEYLYYANRIGLEKYRRIMKVCTIGYGSPRHGGGVSGGSLRAGDGAAAENRRIYFHVPAA